VRYDYKIDPYKKPHPAYPNQVSWSPVLNVRLSNPAAAHLSPTKLLEAVIDSGSPTTVFDTSIGISLGLDVASGIRTKAGGLFSKRTKATVYFHDIDLHLDAFIIRIKAGFSDIPVAGVLARPVGIF
jgi:hypothetical protein